MTVWFEQQAKMPADEPMRVRPVDRRARGPAHADLLRRRNVATLNLTIAVSIFVGCHRRTELNHSTGTQKRWRFAHVSLVPLLRCVRTERRNA